MKTRISAIVCLLCVFGYSALSLAEDPSSQRVADPYADPYEVSPNEVLPNPPTMSSGTPELYMSFMTGVALPRSADATFTDGTSPGIVNDIDYNMKFSIGGSGGVWFPTRDKLAGFDLGMELTGFLWFPDAPWRQENYNGVTDSSGVFQGTSTEIQGLYIGPNFLVRYPMGISETYPNGRWHPYVGIGVGMHQMAMRPGGSRGISAFCCTPGGNLDTNPIPDQRDTTYGWMALAGVKGHLFKYVAAFAEAKYIQAHHDGLLTDRTGASALTFPSTGGSTLVLNQYSSSINTILVHVGLSIHFDLKP
jgi:hypothetical protein